MAFEQSKFVTFYYMLKTTANGAEFEMCCNAENFLLEERLTGQRQDSYFPFVNPVDKDTWNESHNKYFEAKICAHPKSVPETFSDINRSNFLPVIEEDQYLVRLEKIYRLEHILGKPTREIMDNFENYINGPQEKKYKDIIKDDLYKWNNNRVRRPMFAGFWGEVKDIFPDAAGSEKENKDWPHQLRDRFGLGHLDPEQGEPIPVVMLRYWVKDLLTAFNDNKGNIAIPTVLDGKLNPCFCPTPKSLNEGHPVDFSPGDDLFISCEILHRFIEYRPAHLYRVGWICKSPGRSLEKARKIHLELIANDFKIRLFRKYAK